MAIPAVRFWLMVDSFSPIIDFSVALPQKGCISFWLDALNLSTRQSIGIVL